MSEGVRFEVVRKELPLRKLTVARDRVTLKLRPEDSPEIEAHLSAFAKVISEKIRQAPFQTMRGKFNWPNSIVLSRRNRQSNCIDKMKFTVEECGLPTLDLVWPKRNVKLEEEAPDE